MLIIESLYGQRFTSVHLMIKKLLNSFIGLLTLITLVYFFSFTSQAEALMLIATNNQNSIQLQNKVAKGYSSKFCNAIGIGLSKEGAAKLAISENIEAKFNPSLWLELVSSGKKNLSTIDNDLLAEQVSSNVVRDCGYPLGLSGELGIAEFKEYFLLLQKEIINSVDISAKK